MRRVLALAVVLTGCDAVLRLQTVSDRHPDAAVPNLVAWYRFEAVGPTEACAVDEIAGNEGTCFGSVTTVTGPPGHGNAFSLDGTTAYITTPHAMAIDATTALTVAVWVAPLAFPANDDYGCIAGRPVATTGADSWQICARAADSFFYLGGNYMQGSGPPVGAWTHLALTWDGAMVTFWVDGVNMGQFTAFSTVYDSRGLWIGADDDGAGPQNRWIGAIDELQIYNVALSRDDIIGLAQQ